MCIFELKHCLNVKHKRNRSPAALTRIESVDVAALQAYCLNKAIPTAKPDKCKWK